MLGTCRDLGCLLVIIFLCHRPEGLEIRTGTIKTYNETCLPTNDSVSTVHEKFVKIMAETNIRELLFPIKRHNLGGWYFTSGEFKGTSLNRQTKMEDALGRDCAVLRAADKLLDDVLCNRSYTKFLCQERGAVCNNSAGLCFEHLGIAYTVTEQRGTWYDARTTCTKMGKELASLGKNTEPVFEFLKRTFTKFPDIWIGLRRSDYFTVKERKGVDFFYWNFNDSYPYASVRNCVMNTKNGNNKYSWKPMDCNDEVPFVCLEEKSDAGAYSPASTTVTGNCRHLKIVIGVMGVLLTPSIFQLVFILIRKRERIASMLRKWRHKNAESHTKQDEETPTSENNPRQAHESEPENEAGPSGLRPTEDPARVNEQNKTRLCDRDDPQEGKASQQEINKLVSELKNAEAKIDKGLLYFAKRNGTEQSKNPGGVTTS